MNDRLTALRLFVRVARLGSFSAGGRDLSIPQPTASRTISHLERDLGVTLFRRTTRAVSLTEAGAEFLARIEPILVELDEAEHAIRGTGELRGSLRVGLSSSFAIREIAPRLPKFMRSHPRLRIELLANDQWQDLVSDGIDVGLRFGPLPDSTAVARWICSIDVHAVFPTMKGIRSSARAFTEFLMSEFATDPYYFKRTGGSRKGARHERRSP